MLFATVGTTDFDALVECLDDLAPRLGEDVICQIGNGRYIPRNCTYFRFEPSLARYIERARLIVSHGGQGSIVEVVHAHKPLVGISNPDRRDRHQDDILRKFAELNHLVWCQSLDDLEPAIARATQTEFTPYVEGACRIHLVIHEFLNHHAPGRR